MFSIINPYQTMNIKVTKSGFVAGAFHKEGETLEVSERQANTAVRRGRAEIVEGKPKDDKKAELQAVLTEAGVKFASNASLATLQKLVDEAEADPTK